MFVLCLLFIICIFYKFLKRNFSLNFNTEKEVQLCPTSFKHLFTNENYFSLKNYVFSRQEKENQRATKKLVALATQPEMSYQQRYQI